MKFHSLPSDLKVLGISGKLIRNANLKKDSSSTQICGAHFPQGERMSITQVPSIFPWTSVPQERRKIERVQVLIVKKPQTTSVQAENENVRTMKTQVISQQTMYPWTSKRKSLEIKALKQTVETSLNL